MTAQRRHCFDVSEVKRLYCDEGMTQAEIAEKMAISRGTVSLCFVELGITAKSRKKRITIDGKLWVRHREKDGKMVLKEVK